MSAAGKSGTLETDRYTSVISAQFVMESFHSELGWVAKGDLQLLASSRSRPFSHRASDAVSRLDKWARFILTPLSDIVGRPGSRAEHSGADGERLAGRLS